MFEFTKSKTANGDSLKTVKSPYRVKISQFHGFQNGGRPPSWILEIEIF